MILNKSTILLNQNTIMSANRQESAPNTSNEQQSSGPLSERKSNFTISLDPLSAYLKKESRSSPPISTNDAPTRLSEEGITDRTPEFWELLSTTSISETPEYTHFTMFGDRRRQMIDPTKLAEFWNGYCSLVHKGYGNFCLAERPTDVMPIIIDFVFKFHYDSPRGATEPLETIKLWDEVFILGIVYSCQQAIRETLNIRGDDDLLCVVLVLEKNWIHDDTLSTQIRIQFPYCKTDVTFQTRLIRPTMIQLLRAGNYLSRLAIHPMTDWDNIIDPLTLQEPILMYKSTMLPNRPKLIFEHLYGRVTSEHIESGASPAMELGNFFHTSSHLHVQRGLVPGNLFEGQELNYWLPMFLSINYHNVITGTKPTQETGNVGVSNSAHGRPNMALISRQLQENEQITTLVDTVRHIILENDTSFFTRNTGDNLRTGLHDWFSQAIQIPRLSDISSFANEIIDRFMSEQIENTIGANRSAPRTNLRLEILEPPPPPMSEEVKKVYEELRKSDSDRTFADLLVVLARGNLVVFDEKSCAVWIKNDLLWEFGGDSHYRRISSDLLTSFFDDRIAEIKLGNLDKEKITRELFILNEKKRIVGTDKELTGVVRLARPALMRGCEEFRSRLDSNRFLIAVKPKHVIECVIVRREDGTQDMERTLRLRTPQDYLTKQMDFEYEPTALTDPLLDTFLNGFVLNVVTKKDYLFELCGNGFLGNLLQNFLWIEGPGSSGKSSFCNLFINCFRKCVKGTSRSTFISARKRGSVNDTGLTPQLMDIENYRIVFVPDVQVEENVNHASLNQVTGGDVITARKLNTNLRDIKNLPMVIFTSNYRPDFEKIGSIGLTRKMAYFESTAKFRDENPTNPKMKYDPNDPTHIKRDSLIKHMVENPSDHIKSCMLNLVLNGARRLITRNFQFDVPAEMTKIIAEIVSEGDIVEVWLSESYDRDENGRVLARDAHLNFKGWLKDNEYICKATYTTNTFGKKLVDLGVGLIEVSKTNRYYLKPKAGNARNLFPL